MSGFQRFKLRPELTKNLAKAGFDEPRPIQVEAIPPAMTGQDVLGLAQTGTGKTAAFVLPILNRLLSGKGPGPRALVLTPTRELATQVHGEFERLALHTQITAVPIFGGAPVGKQERALRRKPDVIVACPGRLLDLMGRGLVRFQGLKTLVLDEADHMFDMGFLPDVRRILNALPRQRQNLLFSATMPREIRKLADGILTKPAVVELANAKPAETVEHSLIPMSEGQKYDALQDLVSKEDFRSGIVFTRTKHKAKRLAFKLCRAGHNAVALQGNMSQGQRNRALGGFKEGKFDILVATDIAARGLDISGVSHVINFDVPNTPDAYTHRIGRTGRSGKSGVAFTFATPDDKDALRAIEKRLGKPIPRLTHEGVERPAPRPKRPRPPRSQRPFESGRDVQERLRREKKRKAKQAWKAKKKGGSSSSSSSASSSSGSTWSFGEGVSQGGGGGQGGGGQRSGKPARRRRAGR